MSRSPRQNHRPREQHSPDRSGPLDQGFLASFVGSQRNKLLLLVAVAAIGGASMNMKPNDRQSLASICTPDELRDSPEKATDRLIAAFEKGFLSYEAEIAEKVKKLSDKHLGGNIMSPFDLVRANAKNPNKNMHTLHRTHADGSSMKIEDPRYFSYNFAKNSNSILGANGDFSGVFSPVTRVLTLKPDFDIRSAADFLVAHHEITHSGQDANARIRFQSEEDYKRYLAFYSAKPGERPRTIGTDELGAYVFEIEALDLLLDGALSSSIALGKPLSAEEIGSRLQDKAGVYDVLLHFANRYYPTRDTNSLFDEIASQYSSRGFDVYVPTTQGGLMKVR